MTQFSRRDFGKIISSLLGTGFLASVSTPAQGIHSLLDNKSFSLLKDIKFNKEDDWESLKHFFPIKKSYIPLNSANLCPTLNINLESLQKNMIRINQDISFENRAQFQIEKKHLYQKLAEFLKVSEKNIILTRNTTHSNNTVIQGLELKSGDEVIIWDQNHPSNHLAWQNQANRKGFALKIIKMPKAPVTKNQIIDAWRAAFTDKTRVIAFSHISNISGYTLPAKEICKLATEKGILTLIDGAQSFGYKPLNLKDMGCDFYTASSHKWLMGPLGLGVLYTKESSLRKLWPHIVGYGWQEEGTGQNKFGALGQLDVTKYQSFKNSIELQEIIGPSIIYQRVKELTYYLADRFKEEVKGIEFVSAESKMNYENIVIVNHKRFDAKGIASLYTTHKLIFANLAGALRFSPNIYVTKKDLDLVVAAVASIIN